MIDSLFPLTFSNSSMNSFGSCELKGFRSQIQKLRGTNTNGDLLAGGAFATACELSRRAFYEEGKDLEECTEIGETFILESPDTGHTIKTNERVALTFRKYIERFPFTKDFQPCELEDGSYAIEYGFSLDTGIAHPDLPDRNIMFTGKLDGLYEKTNGGKVIGRYVLDEKTTASVSRLPGTKIIDMETETDLFRASSQLICYSFAAKALGINITSGVIRRVPILTTHEDAYELEIPISQFMRDRWAESVFEKIQELKDRYIYYRDNIKGVKGAYAASVFYPSYGSGCLAYRRKCPYMEGCLNHQGEQVLELSFNQMVDVRYDDSYEGDHVDLKTYKRGLGL